MKRIDFYISNNNHHWQMMKPVLLELIKNPAIDLRLVSLCEYRRMDTPIVELHEMGVPFTIIASMRYKGMTTSTGKSIGGSQGFARKAVREIIWWLKVRRDFVNANRRRPDLIVVPNDIAFPFDKMCKWFNRKAIPFVLMQEGIRFPLPNEGKLNYGKNGPSAILAWGESSKNYFESLKLHNVEIIAAGNPRFDELLKKDYSKEIVHIKSKLKFGKHNILYVSNPVDDQGFCTHEEKIELFQKFLEGIKHEAIDRQVKILLRLHPRENPDSYRKVIEQGGYGAIVQWAQEYPLFAILQLVDASVILASTVGLESMMCKTPVAVIKLANFGFVFDYVSSGCALGVDLEGLSFRKLMQLITDENDHWTNMCSKYVENQLSNINFSASVIANYLVQRTLGK